MSIINRIRNIIAPKKPDTTIEVIPPQGTTVEKTSSGQEVIKFPDKPKPDRGGGGGTTPQVKVTPQGQSYIDTGTQSVPIPSKEYSPSKDIFQPKPLPQNVITRIAQQQQQQRMRDDSYKMSPRRETRSIMTEYKPLTLAEKIRLKFFNPERGFKEPSEKELLKSGYQRVTPPPSITQGTGTVSYDNYGNPIYQNKEVQKLWISPSGKLVGEKERKELTSFEVREEAIKQAEKPIRIIEQQKIDSKVNEYKYQEEELFNKYQSKVNSGELKQDKAQELFNKDRQRLLDRSNAELKNEIEKDISYQTALKSYEQTAKRLGATKDMYGKTYFPELEKSDIKWKDKKISEKVTDVLSFIPASAPSITFGKILKEVQESPDYYSFLPTTETTYYKDPKLFPKFELSESAQVSAVLASGIALSSAYNYVRIATKSVNEEKAVNIINQKIRDGKLKLSQSQLNTGRFVVDIIDDAGNKIKQEIKIPTQQLRQISKQMDARKEYLRLSGLGKFRKVNVELVGKQSEKELIKDTLSKKIKDSDELIKIIEGGEIGKFSGITKTGKLDTGYIIQTSKQIEGKGQAFSYVIKTTKEGGIKSLRVIKTDLETGQKLLLRPAQPSELLSTKIPVKGSGQSPLEVSEFNRLKIEKILEGKGTYSQSVKEQNNQLLRLIKKKSVIFEVGGKSKGTTSVQDLFSDKTPFASKLKQPIPIAKSKSIRVEVGKPSKDITLSLTDDLGTVSKKIGSQRDLITIEKGISESIEKPITFKKIAKVFSKKYKSLEGDISLKKSIEKIEPVKEISKQTTFIKNIQENLKKTSAELDISSALKSYDRTPSISKIKVPKISTLNINFPSLNIKQKKESISITTQQNQIKNELANLGKTKMLTRRKEIGLVGLSKSISPKLNQVTTQTQLNRLKSLQRQNTFPALQSNIKGLQRMNYRFGSFPPVSITGFENPFGEKDRGQGTKKTKKNLTKRIKSVSDYSASLASAFFQAKPIKVTKKEFKRLQKQTYSGIETRPVLEIIKDDDDFQNQIKKSLSI